MKREKRKQKKTKYFRLLFLSLCFLCLLVAVAFYLRSDKKPKNTRDKDGLLTEDVKVYESNFIFTNIETYYPYSLLNKKYNNFDFSKFQRSYLSGIKEATTDTEYVETANRFFQKLYGGRVFILSKEDLNFLTTYRKNFYHNNHVIFQKETKKAYENLPTNPEKLPDESITYEHYPEASYIKIPTMQEHTFRRDKKIIEQFLEESRDSKNIILDLRNTKGASYRYAIENIIEPFSGKNYTVDFYTMDKTSDFNTEYDRYNQLPYFDIRHADTMNDLKEFQIDRAFVDGFSQYTQIRVKTKGRLKEKKIYILQNDATQSAADFVLQFAKKTGFAQTIGSESAGFGLSFYQSYIELPLSHFVLTMPISIGINDDLTINEEYGTVPDVRLSDDPDLIKNVRHMIE